MTTHLPNQALNYSNRIILMGKEKAIAVGSVEEVMTEENLSKAYDVDIRILSVNDPNGNEMRLCMPVKCGKGVVWDDA
jgi:iron complex transport system ATP-binding protein